MAFRNIDEEFIAEMQGLGQITMTERVTSQPAIATMHLPEPPLPQESSDLNVRARTIANRTDEARRAANIKASQTRNPIDQQNADRIKRLAFGIQRLMHNFSKTESIYTKRRIVTLMEQIEQEIMRGGPIQSFVAPVAAPSSFPFSTPVILT